MVAASVAPPLMQYLASAEDGLKISQVLNDAMAEVTLERASNFEAAGHVGEESTVGEHGYSRHGRLAKQ